MHVSAVGLLGALIVGALPQVGQAAGTGYVFVSNERSDTVTVIDPAKDDRIVKRIATSQRPRDMHFSLDRKRLYVACGDEDVIDIIDVSSLTVTDHLKTGQSPEIFAFSRNRKALFVSEEDSAIVRKIDLQTAKTLEQIATGPEPEGVFVPKAGHHIYITSEVSDMVHVADVETGKVVKNILVGSRPRRFAANEDGSEIWVTNELSGSVTIIDTATDTIKQTIELLPPGSRVSEVTPVGIALSPDGKTMYLALGRANHVAFVDAKTKDVEAYVLVGKRAWGVAPSPDGKLLYVANGLSDDLSIVDVAAQKAVRTIPTGRVPHTVVIDD